MSRKFARTMLVAAVAVASLTAGLSGPASASAAAAASAAGKPVKQPVSQARVAEHFDLLAGQMPENIALEPDGSVDLTFAGARQIARVSPAGKIRVLATLPKPADDGVNTPALGFPLVTGLVRAEHGTLYFLYATGTADLTGVWRLTPGGTPRRIAALPADGLPNGLALDTRSGTLYLTDSVRGVIWRVPTGGGRPTVWADGAELASTGFLGANGLKVHGGAVWVSNMDKGTVVRFPVTRDGRAGAPEVRARNLDGIDDFAFPGRGDRLLAALDQSSEVALVEPDGRHRIVLTARDGLQNPTSVAVRGGKVYVPSAAYLTGQDPNLVTARIARPRG
ncbi:SMP-30/gluconolactonase/LRE family protein [Streptomyces sp. NPDC092296]|uniref:SMP-30/gluconolactonase/LRE family protein n=1 Tax=Streptomyces sp. NPDC092296 TaxID=3366012 RepID=UPI0038171BBE